MRTRRFRVDYENSKDIYKEICILILHFLLKAHHLLQHFFELFQITIRNHFKTIFFAFRDDDLRTFFTHNFPRQLDMLRKRLYYFFHIDIRIVFLKHLNFPDLHVAFWCFVAKSFNFVLFCFELSFLKMSNSLKQLFSFNTH